MFDNLSNHLFRVIQNIRNRGRLTEENIQEALREVRVALLEADVALPVVRDFINCVKEKTIDREVNKSLTPGQEFIKIIHNELVSEIGGENQGLNLAVQPPAVVLMIGLKGAGKTTSIAKLGKFIQGRKEKSRVLLVSADVYRPAGIRQLEMLAKVTGTDIFSSDVTHKPVDIVKEALREAKIKFYNVLLIDTPGFLHINEFIVDEIKHIHVFSNPVETLFVLDAMTGQEASNIAKAFNKVVPLTGFILTKVDGDVRGGAALSVRYVTGKPIKFLGIGEKTDALEPFYPERIASRILGMGDTLSLIEDIENKIDHSKAKKLLNKLKKGDDFDLTDFLEQLSQIKRMGGLTNLMRKLPAGMGETCDEINIQMNEEFLLKMEAIINSMTHKERTNPSLIKGSQKRRIAAGCGMKVQDVNCLLKRFNDMQWMTKKISKKGPGKMMRNMQMIFPTRFFKN